MKKYIVLTVLIFALMVSAYSQKIEWSVLKKELVGTYVGEMKKGLANGKGTAKGQDEYTGDFKKGLPDGVGVYIDSLGNEYTGAFRQGRKEGRGIMVSVGLKKDSILKGYWDNDRFIKEEKLDPYEIFNKTGSVKPRIFKAGDGNKVEISIIDPFKKLAIFKGVTISYTGAATYRNDSFSRFYYEDATFPMEFYIHYMCRNKLGTAKIENTIQIKINKPAHWIVILNN